MAMTAAELVAYLNLDNRGFTRGMQQAERTMKSSDRKMEKWARQMGDTVAGMITTTGAGVAAMTTQLLKTGIAYNTLQQSSRAALETIMGSGKKANEQMDKLDDFAKNSPFSKAVFIQAQQQLLGFGMAAEDVVPTLDAIQNSVAAVGGSNEEIAGIAYVLAQVTGTGKITAETLNQLGIRGINAADIIGEQMGKSGNAIRKSITKGTLDADKALAALTKGMEERFGGAAAGVKETMTGAADRVKAAWRDVGSNLAAPFVDPKGGGLAIDWMNQFADVIRAVQAKVTPLVGMLTQRFHPAFQMITAALLDAKDAVDKFDLSTVDKALDKVTQYAPAVAGLSGAILAMATRNVPYLGALSSALGPIPIALASAAAASPEMRDGFNDILKALKPLLPDLVDLGENVLNTLTQSAGWTGEALHAIAGYIGPVVDWFTELPEPVKKTALMFGTLLAVQKLFPGFTTGVAKMGTGIIGSLKTMGTHIGNIPTAFGNWRGAVSGATSSLGDFRSAAGLTVGAIGSAAGKGLKGAVTGLTSFLGGPWGIALAAAGTALSIWAQKQQEAKQLTKQYGETLDDTTGKFTDASWETLIDNLSESNKHWYNFLNGASSDSFLKQADQVGLSVQDVKDYILDNGDAVAKVNGLMKDWESGNWDVDFSMLSLKSGLDKQKNAMDESQRKELEKIEADKALKDSTDANARAQVAFKDALVAAGDATKSAEDRANSLKTALDILKGGTVDAEKAQQNVAESSRSLSETLKGAKADANGLHTGLISLKDGQIATTEQGKKLYDAVDRQRTSMLQATKAAYDNAGGNKNAEEATAAARKEYDRQRDALNKVWKKAGLTKGEIELLNQKYFDTPESVISNIQLTGKKKFESEVDYLTRARQISMQAAFEPGTFVADVQAAINQASGAVKRAPKGRGWGVYKPGYGGIANAAGGIDVKGMADGGVTGSSMSVAQMVKPGDIRFAGDRSDVDEAWIPLDGSKRSWKILSEALKRMPGQAPEGMASGGVTADGPGVSATIEPPTVDGVEAPDTALLTDTWQEAMLKMLTSTETAFQQIQADTASGTTAATTATQTGEAAQTTATASGTTARTSATKASEATQARDTQAGQATQTATTAAGNTARTAATKTAATQQTTATRTAMTTMDAQVAASLGHMRSTTAIMWSTMAATTAKSSSGMRAQAASQFSTMARELEATRRGPMANTFAALEATMRTQMPAAFQAGKASIAAAWAGIEPAAKNPVKYIIDTVYNSGIRGVWNKVAEEFDKKNTLPAYTPPGFYDGGQVTGPGTGRSDSIPARLSNGEFVVNAKATRQHLGLLHEINGPKGAGYSQAYKDGGFVRPVKGGRYTSPFGVSRAGGSHMGQDIALGAGSPIVAALAGVVKAAGWNAVLGRTGIGVLLGHSGNHNTYYGHMSEKLVSPGDKVQAGQQIGKVGSTGNSTGPHLHFEFWNGNSSWKSPINPLSLLGGGKIPAAAAGGGDFEGSFVDPDVYTKPLEALKSKLGGAGNGPWATMAQGLGTRMVDTMTGWITDNIDLAGGAGGPMGGPDGAGVGRWRGQLVRALRANGLPTTDEYVNAWLRQIDTESGGNPKAKQGIVDINSIMGMGAKGLLQTIPPTFMANAFPGHGDIFNGYDNMLAAIHYAKGRYGSRMLSVIGHGHGYARGTESALPGYHWVGEQGPELMRFKGGETVRNNNRSRTMAASSKLTREDARLIATELAAVAPSSGTTFNGPVTTQDPDALADLIEKKQRRRANLANI